MAIKESKNSFSSSYIKLTQVKRNPDITVRILLILPWAGGSLVYLMLRTRLGPTGDALGADVRGTRATGGSRLIELCNNNIQIAAGQGFGLS